MENYYDRLNQMSGDRLWIFRRTFRNFAETRAPQAAAGMAYYAFFSLFPLLLVLIAVGSFFLESEQVYSQVLSIVEEAIPVSQQLIQPNLDRVLEAHGRIRLIALLGLVFSASGFFSGLAHNINLAWKESEQRNFFEKRLVAISMIAIILGLLIFSLVFETITGVLSNYKIPILGSITLYESSLWGLFTNLVPWVMIFILFLALYRWVPTSSVSWTAALWGALFAATGWKLTTSAFTWFLSSGLSRYEVIYGSLGAVVALIFLIYIINWIILFGAHLSAAIQRWQHK
jgi:YihY family inner membrane protein